jgi:preprotein translocase subunit YajC
MTAALVYLAILVVAFFFLIVLPQRRRMAAHRALVDATQVGDEIVTTAGIHGTVRELGDATLRVEVAPGVVVTLARGAVAQRRRPDGAAIEGRATGPGTPAAGELAEPAADAAPDD